jgi:hypothetical protein
LGSTKPKGKNLTEGGFDSDTTRNASFASEIGSNEDPGREAELRFEREMALTPEAWALPADKSTQPTAVQPPAPLAPDGI